MAGKATKKVVPTPAADSSQILPPCRSTMRRTSARPIPSPLRHVGVQPAERREDAIVICLGNPQAVVLHVVDTEAGHCARRGCVDISDFDRTRAGRGRGIGPRCRSDWRRSVPRRWGRPRPAARRARSTSAFLLEMRILERIDDPLRRSSRRRATATGIRPCRRATAASRASMIRASRPTAV